MPAPVDPEHQTEHVRLVAGQRGNRRRVVIVAAALVVGVVTAACSTANAATPDLARYNTANTGHAGHGTPAAGTAAPTADKNSGDDDQGDDQQSDDKARDDKAGDDNAKADNTKDDAAKDDNGDNAGDKKQENNGLDVLGRNCDNSKLPEHTGFQVSPACVTTEFGEVAAVDKSPSLLITDSPREVKVGQSFTLKVSTRNLVRDRFLGAAAGGYYLESSFLDAAGIQRGHFHTACRMLPDTDEAPDSSPDPAFFLATQDNKGGADPDTVDVEVTGMPKAGTAQCTSWAGDGSHRIPMMTRANQTPAVDSVRIDVK